MADNTAEIAALRNDIQTLRNNKQDRISSSAGAVPQGTFGADGDTTFRLTSDKGLLMFYKYAGIWYSSPFNIGTWNLEDSINELVQDINVSNITISESTQASMNITGLFTIENTGTFALNTSGTVTGFSHSDLDDIGTGTGTGGNVHPQYTGAWSITNSQSLGFGTAQVPGDIVTGAVEAVLDGSSLIAGGGGLSVNESGYSFTLDNILTLQPSGSTSLHISSAFADKIKLTDNSNDVIIGSSNAGDLNLTPINGSKVLIQGDNSSNNAGLGSSSYASGWAGAGWTVSRPASGFSAGEWMLEVDNMSIRGTLSVYELLINQIRATNGTMFISSVAKVFEVVDGSTIAFEDPSNSGLVPFATGDILICQRVQVGQTVDAYSDSTTNLVKRIVIEVTGTGSIIIPAVTGTTYGTITYTGTGYPGFTGSISSGDDFVRIGSTSDAARRASILLTADFANAPFMDFIDGVDSWAAWKGTAKNKARLGNLTGITDSEIGSLSGFGLYADNVFLKGQMYAESGYIGTKDAGWTINTHGISTDVKNRKIFMGTGGDASTYGHQDCWFLAESYDPGDGDIEARISLGDCFKVDSDSHEIKLSESANNYVHIKAAEPQVSIYSNGARALTFASTGPTFILGDPDASNPNYLQYSGADLTLVSHGDQYFKVASGVTPTLYLGNPAGNSTSWIEMTGGSFSIKNTNSGGTTTTPVSMDDQGNAYFSGSITIASIPTLSSSNLSDVAAFNGTSSSISDVGANADNTAGNETFGSQSELQTSIWGSAANPPLDADNTANNEIFDSTMAARCVVTTDGVEVKNSGGTSLAVFTAGMRVGISATDKTALRVDSSGNLTIGTSNSTKFSVAAASGLLTVTDIALANKIDLTGLRRNVCIGNSNSDLGDDNVNIGTYAGNLEEAGSSNNVNVGYLAGQYISSGSHNVCLGSWAGGNAPKKITTGGKNICIGYNTGTGAVGDDECIVIGDAMTGLGSNSCLIGGSYVSEFRLGYKAMQDGYVSAMNANQFIVANLQVSSLSTIETDAIMSWHRGASRSSNTDYTSGTMTFKMASDDSHHWTTHGIGPADEASPPTTFEQTYGDDSFYCKSTYQEYGGSVSDKEMFRMFQGGEFMITSPKLYIRGYDNLLTDSVARALYVTKTDNGNASIGEVGQSTSSRLFKTNIESLDDVSWLYDLNPVKFQWRKNGKTKNEHGVKEILDEARPGYSYGLIAEEVWAVNEIVCETASPGIKERYPQLETDAVGVNYEELITPLLKAVQELSAKMDLMDQRITNLE